MKAQASDCVTEGIRVIARPFFLDSQSDASANRFVFGYHISIINNSVEAVTLLWRRWTIVDGRGETREVQGSGVLGRQPRIEPGETFEYRSFCPLATDWGTMEGAYTMQRDGGDLFEVEIGRFMLGAEDAADDDDA